MSLFKQYISPPTMEKYIWLHMYMVVYVVSRSFSIKVLKIILKMHVTLLFLDRKCEKARRAEHGLS